MSRGAMDRVQEAGLDGTSGLHPTVTSVLESAWTHHHGLLHQRVAVFAHVLQDFVGCVVPGRGGGLGGHCQRVDEGLKQAQKERLQMCKRRMTRVWC